MCDGRARMVINERFASFKITEWWLSATLAAYFRIWRAITTRWIWLVPS